MARYQIWNKEDTIYTPVGEALTPEQWINRYGWIGSPQAVPVISAGVINGAFIGELGQMKAIYESAGADFSACESDEDFLAAIELFEDEQNAPPENVGPTPEERIAAALEYQVMASLPDV